jgi:hypothetical protein
VKRARYRYEWRAPRWARLVAWAFRYDLPRSVELVTGMQGRAGQSVRFAEAWKGVLEWP